METPLLMAKTQFELGDVFQKGAAKFSDALLCVGARQPPRKIKINIIPQVSRWSRGPSFCNF